MEPITTAIVAAVTAGAAKKVGETIAGGALDGLGDAAKASIGDAYTRLKDLLRRRFGADSRVARAVEDLEADPDSEGYKTVLKEQIARSHAERDPELVDAAQELLGLLGAQPGGRQIIQQTATGSGIAQAAGGSTASVTYGGSPGPRPPGA